MNLTNLTASAFSKIIKLLKRKESLIQRIAKVDQKLAAFVGGKPQTKKRVGKKKHKMSAAGRKAIAAAQRKRWAKIKAGK